MDGIDATDTIVTEGVTFHNVAAALAWLYFGYDTMSQEEWQLALRHVVPMQHNKENPITALARDGDVSKDTFIEYWIDDDDRITQDSKGWTTIKEAEGLKVPYQTDECRKLARVTVRFLGSKAEAWAKLFHHLTKRQEIGGLFREYCNAEQLEYVGSIRPINVDYFGSQNTAVAFDIVIMLQYLEVIKLPGERLGLISIAAGDMGIGGGIE